MNQPSFPCPSNRSNLIVRKATVFVCLLAASIPGIFLSLYGALFGPSGACLLGATSFAIAISVLMLSERRVGIQFLRNCPNGLIQHYPKFQILNSLIPRLISFSGLCAVISLIIFIATIASAHSAGVPDSLPVFKLREHYSLHNHANYTEVSRLRFLIAGTGFVLAWHSGAMVFVLGAIYWLFFGRIPSPLKRS